VIVVVRRAHLLAHVLVGKHDNVLHATQHHTVQSVDAGSAIRV
jgi:hypothetical protein